MQKNVQIGNKIKSYFKLKGWTYADAAKILGCSKQTIANTICKNNFSQNLAQKWANAFKLDPEFFLDGNPKTNA